MHHLFAFGNAGMLPLVYSDEVILINGRAYVFDRRDAENRVEPIDLEALLARVCAGAM